MEKKFQRNENKRIIGGVAAGLSEYMDIEVIWIRIAFILMAILGFSGVLIYLILWIVVPAKPLFPLSDIGSDQDIKNYKRRDTKKPRVLVGFALIIFGIYFTLNQFYFIPVWVYIKKLWPLVLIILGLYMILSWKKTKDIADSSSLEDENKSKGTNDNEQSNHAEQQ